MKDMFREIWEIRGTIDEAIEKHDIELFNIAKNRYVELYKKKFYLKTLACSTAGRVYDSEEEFAFDCESNYSKLAFDLTYSKYEVLQKEFSGARTIQFSCPVEVLYFTRLMFDQLIASLKRGEISKENAKEDFKVVIGNLDETIYLYQELTDKTHIKERITLQVIKQEVSDEYYQICEDMFSECDSIN